MTAAPMSDDPYAPPIAPLPAAAPPITAAVPVVSTALHTEVVLALRMHPSPQRAANRVVGKENLTRDSALALVHAIMDGNRQANRRFGWWTAGSGLLTVAVVVGVGVTTGSYQTWVGVVGFATMLWGCAEAIRPTAHQRMTAAFG